MFKIRVEQKVAFRGQALLDYENRVVRHVERCFPEQWATLGDAGVRATIRSGIERAAAHGIVSQRDVCGFIDLMLAFGADFERRCTWAREILHRRDPGGPAATLQVLLDRAIEEA